MIPIQETKLVILVRPQLKDNGAFANLASADLSGWGHARIYFIMGDTDIGVGSVTAGAAPQLEEDDVSAFSSPTDITNAKLADAISATEDNKAFAIDLDLAKTHKRYVRPKAPTAGDGTVGANMTIIAILSKPEGNTPVTAAHQGLEELVIV